MFIEDVRLTAPEKKIIHEAGSYNWGRDQSCNYHALDFEDFSLWMTQLETTLIFFMFIN